jgi:hypothetical protein
MKIHNVGGDIFLEDEEGNFFIVTDDPEVAAAAEGKGYLKGQRDWDDDGYLGDRD